MCAVGALKSNAISITPHRKHGLVAFPMAEAPEKATQTFKAGALLKNNGGFLDEAAVDAVSGIVGIAAHDGQNLATDGLKNLSYYPALPGSIFAATLEDETNEDHVSVDADLFSVKALQKDTDGIWYVDENDAGNNAVTIVEFIGAVGDTRVRVGFRFTEDATIYNT